MSKTLTLVVAALAAGCSIGTHESRGTTAQKYAGRVQVVFTNASPDTMCGLYMSYDDEDQYGDNWLAKNGLASGQSVKFWVKKGTYKARWDTCRPSSESKFFAGTMCSQMAIDVANSTQLFAYVADKVSPTSRAKPLGHEFKLVRFPGQIVEPIGKTHAQSRVAEVEMSATEKAIANGDVATERQKTTPAFDASAFVETKAKKTAKKKMMKPSTARQHDLASGTVRVK